MLDDIERRLSQRSTASIPRRPRDWVAAARGRHLREACPSATIGRGDLDRVEFRRRVQGRGDTNVGVGTDGPGNLGAIERERGRQKSGLELIASENYTSAAVLEAAGTILTNKYAEGYPGRRYYGGCEFIDSVEELARQRARALFGSEHANVQPHAGSQANMSVYLTVLKPGDTYLAMNLAHGGHLTHGSPVNFSGQLYQRRGLRRPRERSSHRLRSRRQAWPASTNRN